MKARESDTWRHERVTRGTHTGLHGDKREEQLQQLGVRAGDTVRCGTVVHALTSSIWGNTVRYLNTVLYTTVCGILASSVDKPWYAYSSPNSRMVSVLRGGLHWHDSAVSGAHYACGFMFSVFVHV